ncbi:hypothetical protein [Mycolicibacterium peregrinum]|uniref:hypothetical protein n=1 Tax=Mycolicibacterium peregrinum TaxID=43304 RepID=UPI002E807CE9|nr:hypothetical protein [Mycolicibacterium peregrinum]
MARVRATTNGLLGDDVAVDAGMERALRRHESGVDATLRGKDLLDVRLSADE